MTDKQDDSVISLLDYRKKKSEKQASPKEADKTKEKTNSKTKSQIVYMSNYLKTKKIPELKDTQKQNPEKTAFPTAKPEEINNLIILDQYRKEKHKQRVWKKQALFYTKEALNVSGMAFLFLLTFNLAVSIRSTDSPSTTFKTANSTIVRGESIKENSEEKLKESLGLKFGGSRKTANVTETNKALPISHKQWVQKMKNTENIILGKKPASSDYIGF